MDLFENITENQEIPAILLIDASGSTTTPFDGQSQIIDKIKDVVLQKIPNDQFRIIFWNSNTESSKKDFPDGIIKFPHVIKKNTINQPFTLVKNKINNYCLTFPYLGFKNITPEWIDNKKSTHIYYITDGQITTQYNNDMQKKYLKDEIEKLFKTYNNIHLHLYTVEGNNLNIANSESVESMIGGDVYNIFRTNNLTKYITEFISFAPNYLDGYKHINTIIPPSGFIPYEQKCFSELKTYMFIDYVKNEINEINNISQTNNSNSEDALLKIIQNLTTTIKYLTKDKQEAIKNSIVKTFCNLFSNTIIDKTIVEFMLIDSISRENNSFVFSEYRTNLKNLYKQADMLLLQNVKNAIGLHNNFISFPIDNKIIVGNSNYVDKNIKLNGRTYNNSSIEINNMLIPVVSFDTSYLSTINKQCIRQHIRSIIGTQYKIDSMGDVVIHVVLGLMLQVVLSDVNDDIKQCYKNLALIMLEKKRYGKDITEFDNIKEGNLPLPNIGNMDGLFKSLTTVKSILKVECENLTIWYAMCLALGNNEIINKQIIHCIDSINKDFPNINSNDLLDVIKNNFVKVESFILSDKYDYCCPITLKNTNETGGMKIIKHKNCCPNVIISNEGYIQMFVSNVVMCPFCYDVINRTHFVQMPPKTIGNVTDLIFNDVSNPFKQTDIQTNTTVFSRFENNNSYVSNSNSNSSTNNINTNTNKSTTVSNDKNTIILFMRGVVGSGKTTFSTKLCEKLTENGIRHTVQGTDMYCKTGMTMQNAVSEVRNNLLNYVNNTEKTVIIIDTCGEQMNKKNLFGVDFNNATVLSHFPNYNKDKQNEYLAWSLYNVLLRKESNCNTNFWLTPLSVGNNKCVEILNKKAKNLFGNKTKQFNSNTSMESISNEYNNYQNYLCLKMTLDDQVNKILRTIVG